MPTTRPRYTVTDTGQWRSMLDVAQQRWPDVTDRRELLRRLAAAGQDRIVAELDADERPAQHQRQQDAMRRAARQLDTDRLLADHAWQ